MLLMSEETVLKNRVRELRARLELRQSDLAREVGVTRQTILAIEKGRLNPSINIALKAARVLREPVDYVFYLGYAGGEDEGQPVARATQGEPSSARPTKVWDFAER